MFLKLKVREQQKYDIAGIYDCLQCTLWYILVIIVPVGKYDEALVHYKEALDANRSILGNAHPSTLVSINNMGNVLKAQGKRNSRNMISQESMTVFNLLCNTYW